MTALDSLQPTGCKGNPPTSVDDLIDALIDEIGGDGLIAKIAARVKAKLTDDVLVERVIEELKDDAVAEIEMDLSYRLDAVDDLEKAVSDIEARIEVLEERLDTGDDE